MIRDDAPAVRQRNVNRRDTEKAAAHLRERGAIYVRGVYHKRPGWWSADNVFLGARSIEALAELERLAGEGEHQAMALTQV